MVYDQLSTVGCELSTFSLHIHNDVSCFAIHVFGLVVDPPLLTFAGENLGPFLTELVENVVDLLLLLLGF